MRHSTHCNYLAPTLHSIQSKEIKKMRGNTLEKREAKKTAVRVCNHCGGTLRFYRGSLSCLMCGRDVDHACKDCEIHSHERVLAEAS